MSNVLSTNDALSLIGARAAELAPADEPEAVEELRVGLSALVAGDPRARLDAWEELSPRFLEGHVSFAKAVTLLVDLAELLDDPARCALLGLLLALGHSAVDEEASLRSLDGAFASVASRLERLSGWLRLSPRLAKRAARRAHGKRYELDDVMRDLEKVESLLAGPAAEQARGDDALTRTPEAVAAAARAAVIHDDRTAADAIVLTHRCLNAGLPAEVLVVCAKLGEWRAGAEPVRIRALLSLGRVAEAREATTELTRAWVAPATSSRSVNQVLPKREMRELLRDVQKLVPERDLAELARAVQRAEVEVFIEWGTDSF